MKETIVSLFLVIAFRLAISTPSQKVNWDKIYMPDVYPRKLLENLKPGSGIDPIPLDRIIGGDVAPIGKYPYQIAVISNSGGFCGGCLISNKYGLTAAHCTQGAKSLTVYIGAHNVRDDEEDRIEATVPSENIIVHPNWNPETISDDISLIRLLQAVEFTDRIQPIALPTWSEAKLHFEDEYVIATGWGRNANDAGGISPLLRYVKLQVQPRTICKHFFSGMIRDTNICTDTGRGQGTCNGDSGGPLAATRKKDGTSTVIGLTSFGSSIGCVAGWPSVFTLVGGYLRWIRDNTDIIIQD